jgi:hypothetical protein
MKTSIRIAAVAAIALSAILGAPQAHNAAPRHSAVTASVAAGSGGDEYCC